MTWGQPSNGSGPVRVGVDAWLVHVATPEQAASLASWLRHRALACTDVVPAAASVLVDGLVDGRLLTAALDGWDPDRDHQVEASTVTVPVTYDGVDLDRVARLWGVTPADVVRRHTALEFVATFTGFAPGFSYLRGLPTQWAVPRLPSPRPRVPAGSVALADRWCGVYPSTSPGGWLLLGRTDLDVWDLDRAQGPAVLAPGTRVRFAPA